MALANDEEATEIAMFAHCYPSLDEGRETQAMFEHLIDLIPRNIKRRFGYRSNDEGSERNRQAEIDRLDAYTNFGNRKRYFGELPDDEEILPEWEQPEGYFKAVGEHFPGIQFNKPKRRARQEFDGTFADEDDPDLEGMEKVS
jgi:hypothetical protein